MYRVMSDLGLERQRQTDREGVNNIIYPHWNLLYFVYIVYINLIIIPT